MRNLVKFLIWSLLWFDSVGSIAQQTSLRTDSLLTGTWKGSSLCQQKGSPCHDESVVYHISKIPGNDTLYIQANKIVNGVEEDMGIVPCLFDEKTRRLESTVYNGIWSFRLSGNELEGTLIFKGNLYRKIKVSKVL